MVDSDPRRPVTVAELVAALATYPQDANVHTWEAGTGTGAIGVDVEGQIVTVWEGGTSAERWNNPDKVPFQDMRPETLTQALKVDVYCKRCRKTTTHDDDAAAEAWMEAHIEGHEERDAKRRRRA